MGDRLHAGKLSRYVTSHPGPLSLAIPLWVNALSTSLGWEGNRRSGIALAYEREMSTPPTLLRSLALLYCYLWHVCCSVAIVSSDEVQRDSRESESAGECQQLFCQMYAVKLLIAFRQILLQHIVPNSSRCLLCLY